VGFSSSVNLQTKRHKGQSPFWGPSAPSKMGECVSTLGPGYRFKSCRARTSFVVIKWLSNWVIKFNTDDRRGLAFSVAADVITNPNLISLEIFGDNSAVSYWVLGIGYWVSSVRWLVLSDYFWVACLLCFCDHVFIPTVLGIEFRQTIHFYKFLPISTNFFPCAHAFIFYL